MTGTGSLFSLSAAPYPAAGLAVFSFIILFFYFRGSRSTTIPHLNPRKAFELTDTPAKAHFVANARPMLETWFRENPGTAARVIGDAGEVTVLPASLVNEMRNDPRLSFSRWININFHAHLPGFEGFREGGRDSHLVQDVIKKDLTKYLNKITEPLSQETALALEELCPAEDDQAWHPVTLRDMTLRLVSRVSSRVFLGKEVCRNPDWLRVTREYTVDGFRAAEELRLWPVPLRYLVHWFLPSCRLARSHVREARRIIHGLLEKRRSRERLAEKVQYEDAIEWFEREARGISYDAAVVQLILSFVAIHTTTELVNQVMMDLCQNPEIIGELRQEIAKALGEGGWKKTSLYNMKLLDSVIKESLRLKPTGIVSMRRIASDNVEFSNGTFIRRGTSIAASAHNMWDPEVYEKPHEWDGRRFLRMRETAGAGQEHLAQLVSTSPDHLGFGHGQHACPGRFFASNEAKVILIHLLLGYDWRLPDAAPVPRVRSYAFSLRADPTVKMEYRRREPEIAI